MEPKKVVMVTPEFYPHTMVGGLAMAVSGFTNALQSRGVEVHVVMPAYSGTDIGRRFSREPFAKPGSLEVKTQEINGIPVHSILGINSVVQAEPDISSRVKIPTYGVYTPSTFLGFWRFCKALPEAIEKSGLFDADVIHFHDWMAAPGTYFIKTSETKTSRIPTVLTMHNANYTGGVPNLDSRIESDNIDFVKVCEWDYRIKIDDKLFGSALQIGAEFADGITTVSPNEANELFTSMRYLGSCGNELRAILKRKGLIGILNGLDTGLFNPRTDGLIEKYDPANAEGLSEAKLANKTRFIKYCQERNIGNHQVLDATQMWVTMMCRLTDQKGIYRIDKSTFEGNIPQVLIIGEPADEYSQRRVEYLKERTKEQFIHDKFANPELQHLALASSDAILHPCRFEPCGLFVMEGMAYADVPLVTDIGGHHDSVVFYDGENQGYGFKIDPYGAVGITNVLQNAQQIYREQPKIWNELAVRAASQDFSWTGPRDSLGKYLDLYSKVMESKK